MHNPGIDVYSAQQLASGVLGFQIQGSGEGETLSPFFVFLIWTFINLFFVHFCFFFFILHLIFLFWGDFDFCFFDFWFWLVCVLVFLIKNHFFRWCGLSQSS